MSMIWINPVVDSMYDAYVLDEFLRKYGHKRVHASKDWGTIVKEKYWKMACEGNKTVADVRCPKVRELLENMGNTEKMLIPDIEPILIHCGREISQREELAGEDKIIITPCQALAEMGNDLTLPDTRFVTWKTFLKLTGEEPRGKELQSSPIPPGFFDSLMLNTISITGEDAILQELETGTHDDLQLMEMLFCKDGCHTGDGVQRDTNR